MPSISKARLATLEALEAAYGVQGPQLTAALQVDTMRLVDAINDLDGANARIAALEAQLSEVATQHCDERAIKDRAALLRRAKQLAADGVPCTMRGDYITHRETGAILAQVAR